MKIGELFLNLGIKGADTTARSLMGAKEGLERVKSTGLETKAMLAAVIYGMQRLSSASGDTGAALVQFEASTGQSAQTLQKWQLLASRFNVEGEEITGTIKGMQSAFVEMARTGNTGVLQQISNAGVSIDPNKLRDTFYMMDKMQQYAKTVKPDVARSVLSQLGVSEKVFAFLRANDRKLNSVKPSEIFSEKEVKKLAEVNKGWAEYRNHTMIAVGKMNAEYAPTLIKDITKVSDSALELVGSLLRLADSMKFFEGASKVFDNLSQITQWTAYGIDVISGNTDEDKNTRAALQESMKNPNFFQGFARPGAPQQQQAIAGPTNKVDVKVDIHGSATERDVQRGVSKGLQQFNGQTNATKRSN